MPVSINGTNGLVFPDGSTQGSAAPGRNKIINGDFRIDQRNNGSSVTVTTGAYTVDRWLTDATGGAAFGVQRSTTVPAGYINSLAHTVSTADTSLAGTDYSVTLHRIEGLNCADLSWGTADAKSVTLSFWARSSVTGTYGVSIRNAAGDRSYVASYTISAANTFEYKTITIPGDTTGTWLTTNGIGMVLTWDLGVGATYSGAAGAWAAGNYFGLTGGTKLSATLGATLFLTGVQLEKAAAASAFDFRQYGDELALCQRYYYQNTGGAGEIIVGGIATAGGQTAWTTLNNVVPMRANPTGVLFGSATWDSSNATALAIAAATRFAIRLSVNNSVAGQFYAYNQTAPNGYSLNAEL